MFNEVDLVVEMNYERECDLVELWRLHPTSEKHGRNWYISTGALRPFLVDMPTCGSFTDLTTKNGNMYQVPT